MDGQQAGGVDEGEAVVDYVVFGGLHDGGTAEGLDFTAEGYLAARFELTGQEGVAEPDDGEVAGFVADDGPGGGLAFSAESGLGGFPDDGEYCCVLSDFQVGDFSAAREVLVVTGEVVEEIADGVNVEPGKLFGGLGVDTPEVGDGIVEGFRVEWRGRFGGREFWGGRAFVRDSGGKMDSRLRGNDRRGILTGAGFGRVQQGEAGLDPLGALGGGHSGVGTVEEFVDVGCTEDVGAELGSPLVDECVEAVDNSLICESLGLFETEDAAEGVEEAVLAAGGHNGASLPRRVGRLGGMGRGDGSLHARGQRGGGMGPRIREDNGRGGAGWVPACARTTGEGGWFPAYARRKGAGWVPACTRTTGRGMGPRIREDKSGGGVGLALAGDAADGEREGEDGSPPSRGQGEGHIEGSIYKLVGPRMREDKGGGGVFMRGW